MKKNNSNQITMNSNNNSGKRQAIAESKETPSKMKTLSKPSDVIELGIYAGETLRSFLKNHGKKAFPELLKYYNLSEEIMREYHCHLEPHKERPQAVASDKVSTTASTNVNDNMVASNVTSQVDVETLSIPPVWLNLMITSGPPRALILRTVPSTIPKMILQTPTTMLGV